MSSSELSFSESTLSKSTVSEFNPGQRWVSTTEPDLGLGVVVEVSSRRVEIRFPAAGETRVYASDNAPLARIIYPSGEQVNSAEGVLVTIAGVREHNACVVYQGIGEGGEEALIHEMELDSFVHFSRPRDRLLTGVVDKPARFGLRLQTLHHLHQQRLSKAYGLMGARVQLLPHQLYIAAQVGTRHAPRVLLADEVGLGKTIEAGLIVHQQLLSGRASRVLLVVPESLVHQWLVEMLRRFNLHFTVLDADRCAALEGQTEDEFPDTGAEEELSEELLENSQSGINPFEEAQLVLCSLTFLCDNPDRHQQAITAGWDLMVVDEAHHLAWEEKQVSREYEIVEALARQTRGLLLLTATPEQLGMAGHFARLRLLDPDRYYSLQAFREEEAGYQAVNQVVQDLLAENAEAELAREFETNESGLGAAVSNYLGEDALCELRDALEAEDNEAFNAARSHLVASLLDRHGTGRVLFRNTRQGVAGFPERKLFTYMLPKMVLPEVTECPEGLPLAEQLLPERLIGEGWVKRDSRIPWLLDWLTSHRDEKTLLICAAASTARQLEEHLRLREGLRTAVFHEGMSLVERDRAAAYFADDRDSAQVLVCSEIGSEGRNFQFARHLILFDLPLNPDLLEQRIGRLDRIGQRATVEVHVPCYRESAQSVLLDWYQRGLNAFEQVCPVGSALADQVAEELEYCLRNPGDSDRLEQLVKQTATLLSLAQEALEAGRDKLVELNSCNQEVADDLLAAIEDATLGGELGSYLTQVFDQYGVEHSDHSADTIVVQPGDHMQGHSFPGLPEDGLTATFARAKALSRDDLQFFSWEHPLVAGAMEQIVNTDFGSATVCALKLPALKPGTLILEAIFVPVLAAPAELGLHRYLSEALVRLVVDSNGNELTAVVSQAHLDKLGVRVSTSNARELIKYAREKIVDLEQRVESLSETLVADMIEQARANMLERQSGELERLEALSRVNPNIRRDEIDYLKQVMEVSEDYLDRATLQCDALRLAIVTD